MAKEILKIGYVVADEDEYAPLRAVADEYSAKRSDFFAREGHLFTLEKDGKTIEIHSILCGIGMVNAAAAATFLANKGVDILLCSGLSGGISGIKRGELTVGTKYIEHDFDLTPLGYEMCAKPLQKYIYDADKILTDILTDIYPDLKRGAIVSGDCFVGDNNKKEFLKNTFDAMSCDMESSAIAYLAEIAKIPFVTLRKISDDAGDSANESYTDSLDINGEEVLAILLDVILKAAALIK